MKILYSDSDARAIWGTPTLFLAGPSPRNKEVKSWRTEALNILEKLNFKYTVCVPERQNPIENFDYMEQVEWECLCLNNSLNLGVIVFWVPRKFPEMPGLCTNVEFGKYVTLSKYGQVLYGRPVDSERNKYLDWMYEKTQHKKPHHELDSLLAESVAKMDERQIFSSYRFGSLDIINF